MASAKPITVCVTGAAGNIAYSLIFMICRGDMFGKSQPINLRLLDIEMMATALDGVVYEVEDCAAPLVASVLATTDVEEAFKDVDVAVLVGAMPRRKGMQRSDLLRANAGIFKAQGAALNAHASRNVRVLVVGNPANTNCAIAQSCAPDLPAANFTALTRLDHNRAKSLLARVAKVAITEVANVAIWGNHSKTQYPDVSHATVAGKAAADVADETYLHGDFITTIQQRGAAIIETRKLSSAASAAQAICDHMRDWVNGSDGAVVSMAVPSDGSYGIAAGVIYSFPVVCADGKYAIVQGLDISEFSRAKMDATLAELQEERDAAFAFLKE